MCIIAELPQISVLCEFECTTVQHANHCASLPPPGMVLLLFLSNFSVNRADTKVVISSGNDGLLIIWGSGGGVSDKIQVSWLLCHGQ